MLILLLMLWFSHLNKSISEVTHPTDKNDKKIKQMKKMTKKCQIYFSIKQLSLPVCS